MALPVLPALPAVHQVLPIPAVFRVLPVPPVLQVLVLNVPYNPALFRELVLHVPYKPPVYEQELNVSGVRTMIYQTTLRKQKELLSMELVQKLSHIFK